jgi:bifunctional isochorismate lyase/aryl carrier protein
MVISEPYITPRTLEARSVAWEAELAAAGIGRGPDAIPNEKTALLVIDMQQFFLREDSHAFLPAGRCILPNVLRLIRSWQAAGAPVILSRHAVADGEDPGMMARWWQDTVREGTDDASLDDEVAEAAAGLPVLRKTRYSAFHGTGLEQSLLELGVERVVVAGVMTHLCVESTAREAFLRDFEVVLATDATASATEELHLGSLRALGHGFALLSRTNELLKQLNNGGTDA